MGPGLVFFAAIWRGLFFLGHGRFECTPSLSAHANFSAKPGTCVWAGSQISGYIGSSMRKPVVIGNFRIRGTNSQPIQGIDARTAWKNHVLGMAAVLDGGDPGRCAARMAGAEQSRHYRNIQGSDTMQGA